MFYVQLCLNGGALNLPVLNTTKKAAFATLKAAQARLQQMGVHQYTYGYDKNKGHVSVQGRVLDSRGKIVWSIAL